LVAAFVVVAVIGPILAIRQLDAGSVRLVQLAAAGENLDALVRAQLSEETGLRGYISTHDRYFLDPDGPPNPEFDQRADALTAGLRDANLLDALPLVGQIRATHDRWEAQVALPLLRDPVRSDGLAKQTYGKLLTDELRASAQLLRDAISAAYTQVQAEQRRRINATVAISAVIVAVFGISAVTLGLSRATAMRNLARERSLVDALQQTLRVGGTRLPRTEVGFAYASATAEALVGGDLLDSWRDGEEKGWFLIADASGKGIQAARHSAFAQYALRALASESDDPGDVVARFNRLFGDTFDDPGIFVVLFLGRFDARTKLLRYASAGHSAAFIRRGLIVQQLPPTGPIIGMEYDSVYATSSLTLHVGETVLLATDGLTESRDAAGDFLGDEGVARILAAAPIDPQGICDLLVGEAERRSNGHIADDLAILAISVVAQEDGSDTGFSTMEAAPRR
jgi:sigma-B regulation protein RsbU (phosphoserine phosphatase)